MDIGLSSILPITITGASILLTIALFALIILFHEFGHFVVAKLSGMRVHEFSLGFGRPALLSLNWRGTRYSVRPVPIGGYVRIAGMEPDEDVPDGFDKKPILSRLAVIASGSAMNFVLAAALFCIVGLAFGKITGITTELERVLPKSRAAAAGLRPGDRLLYAEPLPAITSTPTVMRGEKPAKTMDTKGLHDAISARADMPLRLIVQRGDSYLEFHITPASEKILDEQTGAGGRKTIGYKTVGRIGVFFTSVREPMGLWESVWSGFVGTVATTAELIKALVRMIAGKLPRDVGGPILVGDLLVEQARAGLRSFLSWSAFISLNVGLVNLLPVPALDGSRLVFLVIEGIRRRPIDKRKEAIVHLIGLALLLILFALVTFKDLLRLVEKYVG